MKPIVKQILLVLVILIALSLLAKQMKPKTYTVSDRVLVDIQANKLFIKKIDSANAEYPVSSPFSEGKNAYPAYTCMKDGTIFAVKSEKPGEGSKCPVCGSTDEIVSAFLPEGQESKDVPGPVQIGETVKQEGRKF
ncbi:MAG: hypothetical protein JW957_05505 [Candidatus Omnitrophica bacterium]|nr:hypothetical protein [Candidatus Omnitrophota bacterium]